MITSGKKVLINRKEYVLGERLGGGQEGSIYDVIGFPKYVIKIINDEKMTQSQRSEIRKHLEWLKELGARDINIRQCMTIPKALLDDHLGYIMLKAFEHTSLKKYITVPNDTNKFDDWYVKNYTFKKRYQVIVNLFRALREIHLSGLIFTDLSPNNVMVHIKENQIVFIDTDNTRRQSDMYKGVLGTPGYMAPEVYREPDTKLANDYNIDTNLLSKCGKLTTETDIFSAAVIAFQLITLQHPFIGDEIDEGTSEDEEKALEIKTDYIFKEGTTNTSTYGLTTKFEEITTEEIRKLFMHTFVNGKDNPSLRPTAEEFLEAFQNALDSIVICPHCGFSRLYKTNQHNNCINCGAEFEHKVSIVIYNKFKNITQIDENATRADLINSIGNYPQYDISKDELRDSEGNLSPNRVEISRVVLEPGIPKYLYLRHFEKATGRNIKYAKVTLSDSSSSVRFEVLNNAFESPFLVERKIGSQIPLNNGKEFPVDRDIIFETKKQGKGILQIFCEFIKD